MAGKIFAMACNPVRMPIHLESTQSFEKLGCWFLFLFMCFVLFCFVLEKGEGINRKIPVQIS